MPRLARIVIPGIPHHISQRGNNKENIFFTHDDRDSYLMFLKRYSLKNDLDILGYCLMTNHVHIIAVPGNKSSMAKAIGHAHMSYAQKINYLHGRCGHLWHERFKSCPFDESYSIHLFSYVELNPVRAGIIHNAWDYLWSSAYAHVFGYDPLGIINMEWWGKRFDCRFWKQHLSLNLHDKNDELIRENTLMGKPIGNVQTKKWGQVC